MYILYERVSQDIINSCGSIGIANILSITKTILNLIQLVGPIIAIVSLAICFTKLMVNPDEKKYKAGLKNSIIALVVLFLVPFIVNLAMNLADESFDIAKCWNNAEAILQQASEEQNKYVDINDDEKKSVIVQPGEYNKEETEG